MQFKKIKEDEVINVSLNICRWCFILLLLLAILISILIFYIPDQTVLSVFTILSVSLLLLMAFGIIIKPVYGIYLIIISIVLESFYLHILDANLKIPYILVAIVLIRLVLSKFVNGKIKVKYNPFRIILFFFLALNLISMLYAPNLIDSLKSNVLYILFASIFFTISILINSEERLRTSLNLLMAATIVASLCGLVQLVGWTIFKTKMPYPNSLGFMSLSEIPQSLRPAATFVEPDQFGKYSMFVILFFIPFCIYKRKNYSFTYLSFKMVNATIILSLISMIISQTRSSWLGFIAGILYYSLFNIKKGKTNLKPVIKIGFAAVIILIVYLLISPSGFLKTVERAVGIVDTKIGGASGITRIYTTKAMINLLSSSPKNIVFGLGSGSLNYYGSKYVKLGLLPLYMAEIGGFGFSVFISIWFNIGLVGLFVFFYLILKFYRVNMYLVKRVKETNSFLYCIIMGSLSAFTGILIASVVADSIHVTYFWVLLGLNVVSLRLGLEKIKGNIDAK